MNPIQYLCGQCKGANFPEGMNVFFCPLCKTYIHPGCWDTHVGRHAEDQGKVSSDHLEPRRGKISAYGIIQWDN